MNRSQFLNLLDSCGLDPPSLGFNVSQTVSFGGLVIFVGVPCLHGWLIRRTQQLQMNSGYTMRRRIVALSLRCFFSSAFRSLFSRRAATRYSCSCNFLSGFVAMKWWSVGIARNSYLGRSITFRLSGPKCRWLTILFVRHEMR